jgi:hypothetical protein
MRSLARQRDTVEIARRLRALGPQSPPRWGRMSAREVVRHLCDSFRMALGERPVAARSTLAQRTIVRWIALYVPLRWPAGLRTTPEVDPQREGSRPGEFATDMAELERLLQRLVAESARLNGRPHPVFGRMSAAAWLRWGYLHTDHHLRQFGA